MNIPELPKGYYFKYEGSDTESGSYLKLMHKWGPFRVTIDEEFIVPDSVFSPLERTMELRMVKMKRDYFGQIEKVQKIRAALESHYKEKAR